MGCNQSSNASEPTKKSKQEEDTKIIVVFGATGNQGGSVARALANDSQYKVKAVTRDPDSEKAKALTELGIEVVKGDLEDESSIKAALEGAYGVFLVTNFWAHMNAEKETNEGKMVVDLVKAAGVKHFIYSGLDNVFELMGEQEEKYKCPHFDCKALVTKYIQQQDICYTVVQYSFYMENLLGIMKPRKGDDGEYVLDMPMGDKELHMICVCDSGEVVHQIFNNPKEYSGKVLGLSSDKKIVAEYAEILNKLYESDGKKFKAATMTPDDLRQAGFPGAADIGAMFDFFQSGKCIRDEALTRKLHPSILNFEQWMEQNKDAFAASLD